MRGVILAGGLGTRMGIVSKAVNKHCNLVYHKPMILYPLATLRDMGIDEILVVTSEGSAGQLINLLGDGSDYGVSMSYVFQKSPAGIADALSGAEDFSRGEPIAVILGDNFFNPTPNILEGWEGGARILLTPTTSPQDFGVVKLDEPYKSYHAQGGSFIYSYGEDGVPTWTTGSSDSYQSVEGMLLEYPIVGIVEKPQEYIGNLMVTGIYMYDTQVWDIIRGLRPSSRGEYEITDVNREYLRRDELGCSVYTGMWLDCGSPDLLLDASNYAREHRLVVL